MTVSLRMCPARGLWAIAMPVRTGMGAKRARPLWCPLRGHRPRGWPSQRRDTQPPKQQEALCNAGPWTSHQHATRSGAVSVNARLNTEHKNTSRDKIWNSGQYTNLFLSPVLTGLALPGDVMWLRNYNHICFSCGVFTQDILYFLIFLDITSWIWCRGTM